jgi:hypothetical protein
VTTPTLRIERNAPEVITSATLCVIETGAGPIYELLVATRQRWCPYAVYADHVEVLGDTPEGSDPDAVDLMQAARVIVDWGDKDDFCVRYTSQEKDQISVLYVPSQVVLSRRLVCTLAAPAPRLSDTTGGDSVAGRRPIAQAVPGRGAGLAVAVPTINLTDLPSLPGVLEP